jgi:IS30 family transposase
MTHYRWRCIRSPNHLTIEAARDAVVLMLKPFRLKILTITCDNGKEYAGHKEIADEKVQFVEKRLNSRPRKCLNVMTPEMVFFNFGDVALET